SPAGRKGSVWLPVSAVLVSRTAFVARLVAVVVTLATTAPAGSVMVPVRVAVVCCAGAAAAQIAIAATIRMNLWNIRPPVCIDFSGFYPGLSKDATMPYARLPGIRKK